MKNVRLTFSIPKDIADMLKSRIPPNKRSEFVAGAIYARFKMAEEEEFLREVAEANRIRNLELAAIDEGLEPEDAILQTDETCDEFIDELDEIV